MFEPFQNFVKRAANHYGIATSMEAAEICHHCRKVIPELFKDKELPEKYITPAYYKDHTLVVNVDNQAWGQEVVMRKEKLIAEINGKVGREVIKKLRTQLKS